MSNYDKQVWRSLEDEEYRREYAADVGTGLAFQIKLLREKNGWTQGQLAERIGNRQPTISQWENPNYGDYSLNSLKGLAAAFDLALMVKFVAFGELVEWTANLTPERLAPPSFEEEDQARPRFKLTSAQAVVYVHGTASMDVETLPGPGRIFVTTNYDLLLERALPSSEDMPLSTTREPSLERQDARAA